MTCAPPPNSVSCIYCSSCLLCLHPYSFLPLNYFSHCTGLNRNLILHWDSCFQSYWPVTRKILDAWLLKRHSSLLVYLHAWEQITFMKLCMFFTYIENIMFSCNIFVPNAVYRRASDVNRNLRWDYHSAICEDNVLKLRSKRKTFKQNFLFLKWRHFSVFADEICNLSSK